jgi:hypothetical protein
MYLLTPVERLMVSGAVSDIPLPLSRVYEISDYRQILTNGRRHQFSTRMLYFDCGIREAFELFLGKNWIRGILFLSLIQLIESGSPTRVKFVYRATSAIRLEPTNSHLVLNW